LARQDIRHYHVPCKLLQLSVYDYFAEVKNGSFGSDESCRQFIADSIPQRLKPFLQQLYRRPGRPAPPSPGYNTLKMIVNHFFKLITANAQTRPCPSLLEVREGPGQEVSIRLSESSDAACKGGGKR
jgi:hypothetical protein